MQYLSKELLRRVVLSALLAATIGWGIACNDSGGGGGASNADIGDNNPDVYVAMGDSITSGQHAPAGTPYPGRVAGITGKTVVNAGQGGAYSANGAGSVGGILQKYKPARLLILYGSNDAGAGVSADQLENNLRAIVGAAKVNNTVPVLGTLPPLYDSHGPFQPAIEEYNARIRNIGKSEGIPVANVAGEFGNKRDLVQADGLHPTDTGTQTLAFAFADKL